MPAPSKDYAEILLRLLRGVDIKPCGCWEWQGAKSIQGYGQIEFENKTWRTHRLMAHIKVADVLDTSIVCHRCDNPCCINPEHIWVGTQKQNVDDRDKKGRRNQARGARQGSAKLTEELVKQIRLDPRRHQIIAADYGITRAHVGNLKANRAWKHV